MTHKNLLIGISLIGVTLLYFFPSLSVYFVQDDFYLLKISTIQKISDLVFFFVPLKDTVWYRPLSQQSFFFIGQLFFGHQPIFFHLLVFLVHALTAFGVFHFASQLVDKKVALISSFLYVTHQLHTTSISWLASFPFVLAPLFLLISIKMYITNRKLSALGFFLLGMLTIEVHFVALLIFICYDVIFYKRLFFRNYISYAYIISFILLIRFVIFPTEQVSQQYAINPFAMLSLFKFYFLRLGSLPLLIGSMPTVVKTISISLFSVLMFLLLFSLKNYAIKKHLNIFLFGIIATVICAMPFLILPFHLAPYYMSLALPFFSMLIALLISQKKSIIIFFLSTYLFLQIIGIDWTYKTHWVFKRAQLAKELVIQKKLIWPAGSEEYFSLGANNAALLFGNIDF